MMNQALVDGREAALLYRKWLVNSDAALAAVRLLADAQLEGRLLIHPRELPWLDRIRKAVEAIF
jgi:hypothetical protein